MIMIAGKSRSILIVMRLREKEALGWETLIEEVSFQSACFDRRDNADKDCRNNRHTSQKRRRRDTTMGRVKGWRYRERPDPGREYR